MTVSTRLVQEVDPVPPKVFHTGSVNDVVETLGTTVPTVPTPGVPYTGDTKKGEWFRQLLQQF